MGQKNYPIPKNKDNRLFYIQHSLNTNTYVYDAKISNGQLDENNPIDEYRILFEKNQEIKPLNFLQKNMAYGMFLDQKLPDGSFEMHLAALPRIKIYIIQNKKGIPKAYVTLNGRKMYLSSLFVKISNGSGINAKIDFVIARGVDFTGKSCLEKITIR